MITRLGSSWRGARALAWAVAYALVLQLVLTSSVLASRSISPLQDSSQFCLNDPSDSAERDGGGDGGKSFVHCPLCLSRVDVALLPPPLAVCHVERRSIEVRFDAPNVGPVDLPCPPTAYRPRGPPGIA